MQKAKNLFSVILFFTIFVCLGRFLHYILVDDTESYTRVMMHELYHQEENIDILFVGSSHCYYSFNPKITDELFQKNTFNAGSSSQFMDTSFQLIQEAVSDNDIEHIFLEVCYGMANSSLNKDRTLMTSTYIISDYMKPSFRKTLYLLNASSKDHYSNSFIPARRDAAKLFEPDHITSLMQKKGTPAYQNYEYDYLTDAAEAYQGKGYVARTEAVDGNFFLSNYPYYIPWLSADWEKNLNDIIDFCDKRNIKLTFVTSPIPNYVLAAKGNYDVYIDKIKQIINGKNVDYYDFNLCKEDFFPNTSDVFFDCDHLNSKGADIFSTVFSEFFTGKITEEQLFYDSCAEKMASMSPTLLGLNYIDTTDSETNASTRTVTVISNRNDGVEYRIVMAPEGADSYVLQDFSPNPVFTITPDDHGVCTVTMRYDSGTAEQTGEYVY